MTSGVAVDYNVAVPMADGVRLASDVFRPRALAATAVILIRTPCDKHVTAALVGGSATDPLWAARSGYVVVVQDVRGTSGSEGPSVLSATRPRTVLRRWTGSTRPAGATSS